MAIDDADQAMKNAKASTTQVAAPDFASDPEGYRAYVAQMPVTRTSKTRRADRTSLAPSAPAKKAVP